MSIVRKFSFWPLVFFAACDQSRIATMRELLLGDACNERTVCRAPLACDATLKTCQPTGSSVLGELCVISADCAPTLYCEQGACAPAGDGAAGETCASTAQCAPPLRCNNGGLGGVCAPAGTKYLDGPCQTSANCLAGLICDPDRSVCAQSWPAPFGAACQRNADCAPETGYYCDPDTLHCTGLGPDGEPVPPWSGPGCGDTALQGAFRVLFEVPGTVTSDFFRLPYPNDARIINGKVNLDGFPRPPLTLVPQDLLGAYTQAISAEHNGFGPNQAVFMRFSGRPSFCNACAAGDSVCASGCMGTGELASSIYVVDLTRTPPNTGTFLSNAFTPISYGWDAATGSRQYICGPHLVVAPQSYTPWQPGHTYAVFVNKRIQGRDAQNQLVNMSQDSDFAAMLSASAPADSRLSNAWTAYKHLRDWLATSPQWPSGDFKAGTTLLLTDIGGATVFTVRDPTVVVKALSVAASAHAAPVLSDVAVCSGSPSPACATSSAFNEVRGTIALPNYQQGTLPYLSQGGAIVLDNGGVPQEQNTIAVPFALSVPTATAPVGGWPLLIYAHGTGGSYRSHIEDGTAQALASLTVNGVVQPVGFAVLGIDQVGHGVRRGSSTLSPEQIFFNLGNPQAARGNTQQAAVDQLMLVKAVSSLSTALAGIGQPVLNAAKISFFGHSQGANVGIPAMAVSANVANAVFSGGGGGLIDALTLKTSPYPTLPLLRLIFADPALIDGRSHPALNLLQSYLDDADPVNYAPFVVSNALGGAAKNLLHVVGVGDSFTPNKTGMTLSQRFDADVLDTSPASGLVHTPYPDRTTTAPVKANKATKTRVTTINAATAGEGHFVVFEDVNKARERVLQFLGTALTDGGGVPTVVP